MGVADVAMAVDAQRHFAILGHRPHLMDNICMAVETRALRNVSISLLDLDRLVEVLERKGQGMEEAVVAFGDPFADRMMREMTIVADGDVAMAGILPGVVMTLHDVAIRTRCGIVTQVAPAFAVAESKRPDAEKHAQQHGENGRNRQDKKASRFAARRWRTGLDLSRTHRLEHQGEVAAKTYRKYCAEFPLAQCTART